MSIEIGKGNEALYLELQNDGGARFIVLSDLTEDGDSSEIQIELKHVDDLISALRTLQQQAATGSKRDR